MYRVYFNIHTTIYSWYAIHIPSIAYFDILWQPDSTQAQATMAAVKRHFDAEEFEEALPLVTEAGVRLVWKWWEKYGKMMLNLWNEGCTILGHTWRIHEMIPSHFRRWFDWPCRSLGFLSIFSVDFQAYKAKPGNPLVIRTARSIFVAVMLSAWTSMDFPSRSYIFTLVNVSQWENVLKVRLNFNLALPRQVHKDTGWYWFCRALFVYFVCLFLDFLAFPCFLHSEDFPHWLHARGLQKAWGPRGRAL